MPALEIKNLKRIKDLAHTLALPIWLVKLLIIEYLPCRRFHGNTVVLDYGLVTASDIKSIAEPYVILNGLTLFHNITDQVLTQRLLAGFGGFPMTGLAKQEPLVSPEGKVSPYCLPFPQMNIDEVEGDYKLRLNLHKRAVVMDVDGLYQWIVTTNAMIPADISQRWYESDIFNKDELEELYRINRDYTNLNQLASSPDSVQQRLEMLYEDLEAIHVRMRKTVLDYHEEAKSRPEAVLGYTEEAPPQLTLFDEFTLVDDNRSARRHFRVRSYVEPIFFRAANRAAARAREARKGMDAGEIYPIPIAEEIEASAESIVLSAMCLEAYINGFVQDHLPHLAKYIEGIDIKAKWLSVPSFLGKPDCFKPDTHPYGYFSELVKWRNNDLVHYKHEFRPPKPLGKLGTVSQLHSVCNADNGEKAVRTIHEMVRQLNECCGFPLPAWIQENNAIASWLRPVEIVTEEEKVKSDTSHGAVKFKIDPSRSPGNNRELV